MCRTSETCILKAHLLLKIHKLGFWAFRLRPIPQTAFAYALLDQWSRSWKSDENYAIINIEAQMVIVFWKHSRNGSNLMICIRFTVELPEWESHEFREIWPPQSIWENTQAVPPQTQDMSTFALRWSSGLQQKNHMEQHFLPDESRFRIHNVM